MCVVWLPDARQPQINLTDDAGQAFIQGEGRAHITVEQSDFFLFLA